MLRRRWPIIALISVAGSLSIADHLGIFGTLGPDRQRYDRAVATIMHVVDGDTCDIDIRDAGSESTRVRLLGIDCPEMGDAAAHFGRDAAEFARSEFQGKRVRIVLDPTRPARDRHGRLLAYLFFADKEPAEGGSSLNQELIDRGFAYADWRFEHVHELRFERAERMAMRSKAGMWREMTREKMPQWRKQMMNDNRDGRR